MNTETIERLVVRMEEERAILTQFEVIAPSRGWIHYRQVRIERARARLAAYKDLLAELLAEQSSDYYEI